MSKKLSDNIAKLTGAIEKNIEVSKKGTTSPSNEGANPNEVFLTAICGSLAGVIYGETNGDADKLLQCLGKKPMLFDEIAKLSPEKLTKDIESFATKAEVQLKDVITNVELSYGHMYNAANIVGDTISTSDEFIGSILVDGYSDITDCINVLNNDINEVIGDILLEGFTHIDSIISGDMSNIMNNGISGITEIVSCLGPKGAIVAAIIEAVFSLVKMLKLEAFEKYFEEAQKTLDSVVGVIGPFVDAILEVLMYRYMAIFEVITSILTPIGEVIERLSEPMEKIQSQISEITDSFNNLITTGIVEIVDILLNVITPILEPISLCLTEINDVIHSLTDKVSSISDSAEAAANIAVSVDGSESMTTLIDSVKGLTGENIENIVNLTSVLEALSMVDLSNMDKVEQNTQKLETVVGNINKVDKKEVTNASDLLAGISAIVLTSGAVLLIGSLMMEIIEPKNLLKFSVVLLTFVSSLLVVAAIISKFIDEGIQYIREFSTFVFTCGIVLLIGSLLSQSIDIKDMLKFTFMMALFVFGVTMPFKWFTKEGGAAIKAGREFSSFVTGVSIIMFLGALLVDIISFGDVIKFGAMLASFVMLTVLPFIFFSTICKNAVAGIDAFKGMLWTCSIVMFLGALLVDIISFGEVIKFTSMLSLFIFGVVLPFIVFNVLAKDAIKAIDKFKWLIITCTAIMFIGSLIMKYFGLGEILLFTGALMLFIMGVSIAFLTFAAISKAVKNAATSFMLIVITSTIIMFVGAYLMNVISFGSLLLFVFSLAFFIAGVSLALALFGKAAKQTMDEALAALAVVGLAALIMLIGAFTMQFISLLNLFIFVVALDAFLIALCAPFMFYATVDKQVNKSVKDFGILVALSAGVLIVGGLLFTLFPNLIWGLPIFGAMLAAFVFGICAIYGATSKMIQNEMTTAKQFGILIAISAATLLVGGLLFVLKPELIWGVPIFGVMLFGFMMAMVLVLKLLDSCKKDIMKGAIALTIMAGVVAVLTLIMWGIGAIIENYGLLNILAGVGIMALIVVAMGLLTIGAGLLLSGPQAALFGIGIAALGILALAVGPAILLMMAVTGRICEYNTKGWLKKIFDTALIVVALAGVAAGLGLFMIPFGIPFAIGCVAITALAIMAIPLAIVMGLIAALSKYDAAAMLKMVGIIAATMLALAGIATGIGLILIIPFVGKAFRKGLAVLPVLASVALMSGIAMMAIAGAMKILQSIGKFDSKPIIDNLTQVLYIAPALAPFNWKFAYRVQVAAACIRPMSKLISELAKAVEDYANMKVPVYEGTEIVGYRQLKGGDFKSAAKNIKTIITTLSGALISVYNENPDMFADSWFSDSPFKKVCDSTKKLGELISNIADGIKDYALLMIPTEWDNEGKAIAYKQLKNKDFRNAANNIYYILTTLVDAVSYVYYKNEDLFSGTGFLGFGDSPVSKVLEGLQNLGDIVGKLTESVIKISTGNIPTAWDSTGKAIKFKALKPKDYLAAADIISEILVVMVKGIERAYDAAPKIFTGTGWFGWGDCKAKKVMESIVDLGDVIGGIAGGVIQFATSMIPDQWDKKTGTPIHYIKLTRSDYNNAANSIVDVLCTVVKGVDRAYWSIPGSPSQIKERIDCFKEIGQLIGSLANGVKQFAGMQIADKWNDEGTPIHYIKLSDKDITYAKDNIAEILVSTALAVSAGYAIMKSVMDEGKMTTVLNLFTKIGKTIGTVGENVANFASLRVPDGFNPDGSAKAWKTLDKTAIGEAKVNIIAFLGCMSEALQAASKEAKKNKSFENAEDLLSIIQKFTKSLSGVANVMAVFGSGLSPVLGKEGEVVSYIKFDTAKALVGMLASFRVMQRVVLYASYMGAWINKLDEGGEGPNLMFDLINKFVGGLEKLSKVIGVFGSGLSPVVGKDGGVVAFLVIDFKKAAENIESIMLSIPETIADVYYQNRHIFSESGCERMETIFDTIFDIVDSFGKMGEIIASVSTGLVPIKNGDNLIFLVINFEKLKSNLYTMLSAFPDAIMRLYEECTGFNLLSNRNTANNIIKSIDSFSSIADTVSDAMPSIAKISKELIDMVSKFDPSKIIYSRILISAVFSLTTLISKLAYTANRKGKNDLEKDRVNIHNYLRCITYITSDILYYSNYASIFVKNAKLINVIKLSAVISRFNIALKLLQLFGTEEYKERIDGGWFSRDYTVIKRRLIQIDTDKVEQAYLAMSVISNIFIANNIVAKNLEKSKAINIIKLSVIMSRFNITLKLLQLFGTEEYQVTVDGGWFSRDYTVTKRRLIEVDTDKVEQAYLAMSVICNMFTANNIIAKNLEKSKFINIIKLSAVILRFNLALKLLDVFGMEEYQVTVDGGWFSRDYTVTKRRLIEVDPNKADYAKKSAIIISKVIIATDIVARALQKARIINIDKFNYIINVYNNSIKKLESINTNLKRFAKAKAIKRLASVYINTIEKILYTQNLAAHLDSSQINKLTETINTINEAAENIDDQYYFDQQQKIMARYVQTVNSINIQKVSSLTKLLNSMNTLAYRMGNLDNFTKVLADNMAMVLDRLTNEMRNAKETIKSADKLQQMREASIKKSITEIKQLMSQTMVVEISQSSVQQSSNQQTNNSNGNTSSGSSSSTGGLFNGLVNGVKNMFGLDGTDDSSPAPSYTAPATPATSTSVMNEEIAINDEEQNNNNTQLTTSNNNSITQENLDNMIRQAVNRTFTAGVTIENQGPRQIVIKKV